jgi:hypothetical protein
MAGEGAHAAASWSDVAGGLGRLFDSTSVLTGASAEGFENDGGSSAGQIRQGGPVIRRRMYDQSHGAGKGAWLVRSPSWRG